MPRLKKARALLGYIAVAVHIHSPEIRMSFFILLRLVEKGIVLNLGVK